MAVPTASSTPPGDAAPVQGFSECHAGILAALEPFEQLPALAAAAARLREVAGAVLALFDGAVLEHHADEEAELFPAVLRSAAAGAERAAVQSLMDRLGAEHRAIEESWKQLRPLVRRAAAGEPVGLDKRAVADLVQAYRRHAALEEHEFLPLAREILGRNGNHMAALGLSLHLRHAPPPPAHV